MNTNTKYLLYLLAITFILSSCRSAMPVDDAQNVALQFQSYAKKVPPRGLGPTIEAYLSHIDENELSYATICDKVTNPTPQKDIEYFKRSKHGFWELQKKARSEYLVGNIENAILYSKAAVDIVPSEWDYSRARCLYDNARFLAEAGDLINAKRAFNKANSLYRKNNPKELSRRINRNYLAANTRAAIKFAEGDIKGAKKYFEKALATILDANKLYITYYYRQGYIIDELNLGLARCALAEGNLLDAEIYVRKTINFSDTVTMPHIFIMLSHVFYEQGRYKDAETVVNIALNMITTNRYYCYPKDALVRARVRQMMARIFIAKKQWKRALVEFDLIQIEMGNSSDTYKKVFDGSTEQSLALLMSGSPNKAIQKLSTARNKLSRLYGEQHFSVYETIALEAIANANLGNKEKALKTLGEIVPKLLLNLGDQFGDVTSLRSRLTRLKYIVESHIEMLVERGHVEDIESAFSIANALNSQSVGQAIKASSVRSVPNNPELAILIRSKQDLEMQATAQQNRLVVALQVLPHLQNKKAIKKIKTERDEIIKAIDSLSNRINQEFPEYTNLFKTSIEPISEVFSYLKTDEAVLSYFVGEKATYIWALSSPNNIAFHKIEMGIDKLNDLYQRLRHSISNEEAKTLSDIPEYDFDISYQIFANLVKPLKKIWGEVNHLIIVADGPIMQIPLSCLVTERFSPKSKETYLFENYKDAPWLVNNYSVTYIPTLSSLKAVRNAPSPPNNRQMLIGFGDPIFNSEKVQTLINSDSATDNRNTWRNLSFHRRNAPNTRGLAVAPISALPQLPETSDELMTIAEILKADKKEDVYVRERASEYNVKNLDLSNRKIVIFATHNLLSGDIDGLLEPALVLSNPEITGENEDGLLTMGEIMNLKLNSDWVILSACNTAAGEGKEAEALSGLGQAFFYAGTRSILVSSWPVETNSAMELTTQIFDTLVNEPYTSRSQAVQKSRIKMIKNMGIENPENRKLIASYAHPIFWAPFIVVGEGGGVLNN